MMDAINLGETIVNWVVAIMFAITLISGVFLYRKNYLLGILFVSVLLNFLSIFCFLGTSSWLIFFVNIVCWPLSNLFLIIKYLKIK